MSRKYIPSITCFIITVVLLGFVKGLTEKPLLAFDRFLPGFGWFQISLIGSYAAFLVFKMLFSGKAAYWRKISWSIFAIVFFLQLFLGILVDSRFLMSGDLHVPVPMVILGGSIFRFQLGFMPILFLSTIVLSGSAWCSHLCYFGAFDYFSSLRKKGLSASIENKTALKYAILTLTIFVAITLRLFNASNFITTWLALSFGVLGLLIIILFSRKTGKMLHCTIYCPIGSIVNLLGKINPYRIIISNTCTDCLACSSVCKYDALSTKNISLRKPAYTCTNCGDCLSSCHTKAIQYSLYGKKSERIRQSYFILVVSIHAVFLALARI